MKPEHFIIAGLVVMTIVVIIMVYIGRKTPPDVVKSAAPIYIPLGQSGIDRSADTDYTLDESTESPPIESSEVNEFIPPSDASPPLGVSNDAPPPLGVSNDAPPPVITSARSFGVYEAADDDYLMSPVEEPPRIDVPPPIITSMQNFVIPEPVNSDYLMSPAEESPQIVVQSEVADSDYLMSPAEESPQIETPWWMIPPAKSRGPFIPDITAINPNDLPPYVYTPPGGTMLYMMDPPAEATGRYSSYMPLDPAHVLNNVPGGPYVPRFILHDFAVYPDVILPVREIPKFVGSVDECESHCANNKLCKGFTRSKGAYFRNDYCFLVLNDIASKLKTHKDPYWHTYVRNK